MRYFQPASNARGDPLNPTSSAEAAVVASTTSQAPPRLPESGTVTRAVQNSSSTAQYVRARRCSRTTDDPIERRYEGDMITLPSPTSTDHTDEQAGRSVDDDPLAHERLVRSRERDGCQPSAATELATPPATATGPTARRGARETSTAAAAGNATASNARSSRLVTEAPQSGRVSRAELDKDPLVEHTGDERDEQQVDGDADLDRDATLIRAARARRGRARSRRARSRAPGTASPDASPSRQSRRRRAPGRRARRRATRGRTSARAT